MNVLSLRFFLYKIIINFYVPSGFMINQFYFAGSFKISYKGLYIVMNNNNKRGFTLENKLFWNRVDDNFFWEKQSINLRIRLASSSEVIIDIGANTGIYSLLAKAVNPRSRVIGFEPIKRIFNWYVANSSINGFDIECYHYALLNTINSKKIYIENSNKMCVVLH
ncbi:hypothetical protein ACS5NO_03675 [Larkinella sp. GY13]|uniref:hypothetical protein n=1 Tax=Larkinella sp. GY13 TaxID=3453720 RepID=UPI003EE953A5